VGYTCTDFSILMKKACNIYYQCENCKSINLAYEKCPNCGIDREQGFKQLEDNEIPEQVLLKDKLLIIKDKLCKLIEEMEILIKKN